MAVKTIILLCQTVHLAFIVFTGSPGSADPMLEAIIQEKLKGFTREASDRNDKYRKCRQMLVVGNILFTPVYRSCVSKFYVQTRLSRTRVLQR